MSKHYKGICDLYDTIISGINERGENFYKFIKNSENFSPGQIVWAPVWYEKLDRWYLTSAHYDAMNEAGSTWFVNKMENSPSSTNDQFVMKYFRLEKNEQMYSLPGKVRSNLLVKNTHSDWLCHSREPTYWYCIPIFSYKDRHTANFVRKDQKLESTERFYMPPSYNEEPGMNTESCLRFDSAQMVDERLLQPMKLLSPKKKMKLPVSLSITALKVVMFHFVKSLNLFSEFTRDGENQNMYDLFSEFVLDEFQKKESN